MINRAFSWTEKRVPLSQFCLESTLITKATPMMLALAALALSFLALPRNLFYGSSMRSDENVMTQAGVSYPARFALQRSRWGRLFFQL